MSIVVTESGALAGVAGTAQVPATASRLPAADTSTSAERRLLPHLLSRAPLVHAAVTGVLCTWIIEHPAAVLLLMLGFPALLVAQEVADRQSRELGRSATAAELCVAEPAIQDSRASEAGSHSHTQPRGFPVAGDRSNEAPAAA